MDLLSQEEIDAMLDVVVDDDEPVDQNDYFNWHHRQITLYDFKRPNRVSKNQMRALRNIHDKMSQALASKLSIKLKSIVEIQLHCVDQMTYGEFLMSLPNPTSFNVGKMNPLDGKFAVEINPCISFPIIDRLLGGTGEPFEGHRDFSVTEKRILSHFLEIVEDSLEFGWKDMIETEFIVENQENSPNAVQIVAQNEIVVMVVMEIIIGHSSGMLNICYPVSMIENSLNNTELLSSKEDLVINSDTLGQIEVSVDAIAGKTIMTLDDILNLKHNDVLLFPNTNALDQKISLELDNDALALCENKSGSFKKQLNLITKVKR